MLPFAAIAPMDVAQQTSVAVHAEERVRSGSDIKASETELAPSAHYDVMWKGGQNHFVLTYSPRFIYTGSWDRRLPDPNLVNPGTINLANPNDTPLSVLHNGGAGFEAIRERWRLAVYQYAAYGPISTTSLLIQAPWDGGELPPDPNPIIPVTIGARFRLLFLQSQVLVPIKLTPRLALVPELTYNAFGGADRSSRGVIALTQGPGASIGLEWDATRHDRLTTHVGGGRIDTTFQDDREGVIILRSEATESWRHWYTSHVSSEVVGGAALGGDSINGFTGFSIAQAGLLYDSYPLQRLAPGAPIADGPPGHGARWQLGLAGRVAPWIDLFSGDLEQRAVLVGAANYTFDRTTLRATVSQARVIATPQSVAKYQLVMGEGGIRYRIAPTFALDGGARVGYQDFDNAVRFNTLTQVTVYGGFYWNPLPARL